MIALFVVVVAVGGEYEYKHLAVFHLIDQTVLLGDAARPFTGTVAREWVGGDPCLCMGVPSAP